MPLITLSLNRNNSVFAFASMNWLSSPEWGENSTETLSSPSSSLQFKIFKDFLDCSFWKCHSLQNFRDANQRTQRGDIKCRAFSQLQPPRWKRSRRRALWSKYRGSSGADDCRGINDTNRRRFSCHQFHQIEPSAHVFFFLARVLRRVWLEALGVWRLYNLTQSARTLQSQIKLLISPLRCMQII